MKTSSTCGLDNISSYIIKLALEELLPAITHIINLSISQRKFPSSWKIPKIIPLHKKDEKILAKNYRPVSLLSAISKILEKAIFLQLFQYMEENALLHPSHHAYRPLHNTTTALVEMVDHWIDSFENGEITAAVMIDQSAAFDVCDHQILLGKLQIYGLQEGALAWLASYLENREQTVYIEGALFKIRRLGKAGVPQGGNLSPLLYSIFCSDLPEVVHDENHEDDVEDGVKEKEDEYLLNFACKQCGKIVSYADDCTYSFSDKDPVNLQNMMEEYFNKISQYMDNNKLFLNSDKTHLMILTSSKSHSSHNDYGIKLNTGSEIIEPSPEERLLGANLTNNFLWKNHLRDHKKSVINTLKSKNNAHLF